MNNNNKISKLKSRNFLFTLNQIEKYNELLEIIKNVKYCDYYISCSGEAPTTGHKYIHLYTHFSNGFRITKQILDLKVHIEVCRGSPKQNIDFIESKGNILDEYGIRPIHNIKTIGDLKKIKDPSELNWRMRKTWYEIQDKDVDIEEFGKMLNNIKNDKFENIEVYYIFGPSKVNKLDEALKIIKEHENKFGNAEFSYVSHKGKYWNGLEYDCKIALYENFRDKDVDLDEFIHFIDSYKQQLEIKQGYMTNNYELVIITSVQNPKDIYKEYPEEDRQRISWRITKIIDLTPKEAN